MKDNRVPTPTELEAVKMESMEEAINKLLDDAEMSMCDRVALLELMKFKYLQTCCPVSADDVKYH